MDGRCELPVLRIEQHLVFDVDDMFRVFDLKGSGNGDLIGTNRFPKLALLGKNPGQVLQQIGFSIIGYVTGFFCVVVCGIEVTQGGVLWEQIKLGDL